MSHPPSPVDPARACVLTFGDRPWYREGVVRTKHACAAVGWSGALWRAHTRPPGCPSPDAVRCAFKYYMFRDALAAGHRTLLWIDASVWPIRRLEPLFATIRERGVYLLRQGWNTGQWCTDDALDAFDLSRETAFTIPQVIGGVVGVHYDHPLGRAFLDAMIARALEERTFRGPRFVADGWCSDDPRVLGHRADQTVASLVAHRLDVPLLWPDDSAVQLTYDWKSNRWDPAAIPAHKRLLCRGGVRSWDLEHVPYPEA